MAEATRESSPSEHTESPVSMFARNDDALTRRLRLEDSVGIDELINLHRATSPFPTVASSSGPRSATVFSSRKDSPSTKPTSAGTSYPVMDYMGKGKATATYASSLSATQGSASEAEADIEATRDNALLGLGDWTAEGRIAAPPLKGSRGARKRQRVNRRLRNKKPEVFIHYDGTGCAPSDEEGPAVAKTTVRRDSREVQVKYLRHRRNKPEHDDQLNLAEEGRLSEASTLTLPPKPLSKARSYILIGLVIAIVLTFALATFAAHHTGKLRMACTKGIIFSASVLMSCFTVLAMVVARQALQTALLAGLLEFLVGFGLVIEIHDFM